MPNFFYRETPNVFYSGMEGVDPYHQLRNGKRETGNGAAPHATTALDGIETRPCIDP
jgi:hypothetical protein